MNATNTRPVNEKAMRRWINEQYQGTASAISWTLQECLDFTAANHVNGVAAFQPLDWTATPAYREASVSGRASVDAVFNTVRHTTGPDYGLEAEEDGALACLFSWHDGAQYRVKMTAHGTMARLFRMELTGAWALDKETGQEVPEETWRTVRAFTKDRAGKVLTGLAALNVPMTASWLEASGR